MMADGSGDSAHTSSPAFAAVDGAAGRRSPANVGAGLASVVAAGFRGAGMAGRSAGEPRAVAGGAPNAGAPSSDRAAAGAVVGDSTGVGSTAARGCGAADVTGVGGLASLDRLATGAGVSRDTGAA